MSEAYDFKDVMRSADKSTLMRAYKICALCNNVISQLLAGKFEITREHFLDCVDCVRNYPSIDVSTAIHGTEEDKYKYLAERHFYLCSKVLLYVYFKDRGGRMLCTKSSI